MRFVKRARHQHAPTDLLAAIPQADLAQPLPKSRLADVLRAIVQALDVDLSTEALRLPLQEDRDWLQRWPGEHYKFLRALAEVTRPGLVLDIGTYHGASALALATSTTTVVTYDVVSLEAIGDSDWMLTKDFTNISQRIGDLAQEEFFNEQLDLITAADVVLVDGPKDGAFEYRVVPKLLEHMRPDTLMILDDIRFANMQNLWRSIDYPRIDIGSFAHSTGTGIIFR